MIISGHGKSWLGTADCGAVYKKDGKVMLTEREINVAIGKELFYKLKNEFPTKFIQPVGIETEASISKKQAFIRSCLAENAIQASECLAVELHCNSVIDSSARGAECYFSTASLSGLCSSLSNHVSSWFGTKNRGAKTAYGTRAGYILSNGCPSILLEMGFLSNSEDRKYLGRHADLAETISFILQDFVRSF